MNNIKILQQSELKVTDARLAVLNYLQNNRLPLTADVIHGHLKTEHDKADMATIYRILDAFYKKGIINRLEFHEGKFRYEISGSDHHHLICSKCGAIEDVQDCGIDELEDKIREERGFVVKAHSLEFFGNCKRCQL